MRPTPEEYAEYYGLYVDRVPDGEIVATLADQMRDTQRFLAGIGEEQAGRRYAPDKWSIKQVVGHVTDIERVFATRALAFARGDRAAWPGIDQEEYMAASSFDRRSLADVSGELAQVREASLALFRSLDGGEELRRGTASGCVFTVRSIAWILAGHELHHVDVVRERYL